MSDISEEGNDCRRLVASRCDLMMRESAMSVLLDAADCDDDATSSPGGGERTAFQKKESRKEEEITRK